MSKASRHRMVLSIASFGVFLPTLDITIVNIAFPDIARHFAGVSEATVSWVLNAYYILFAALLVPAGRLADRFGRRRIFLTGIAVFTTSSLAAALAPSIEGLIAARVVQAFGAALMVPTSLALLLAATPVERLGIAVSTWAAAAAVAAGIGPSLGGALVALADWRLVFFVNLPLGFGLFLLSRPLEESRDPNERHLVDVVSTILLSLAVAALALGIVQGHEWGWRSGRVLAAFIAFAPLTVLFLWRSSHHRSPVVELALFRIRSLTVANAASLIFAVAFAGTILGNVLFLTSVWNYSLLSAGLALTPAPLAAALAAGVAGRLSHLGSRAVSIAGVMMYCSGVLWYASRVGVEPRFFQQWLPGGILSGAGIGATFAALAHAAVAELPPNRFATGSALNAAARQIGGVLGVAILIAILAGGEPSSVPSSFDRAWIAQAITAAIAGIACLALGARVSHAGVAHADAIPVDPGTPA